MNEIIEGTAVEVPERALVVAQQPGQALVTHEDAPEAMVGMASRLASALRDIVEKQRLYATIQGKKYPQVEAWMTIARMDNVVCREVAGGILRREDGAYEAEVELIRLSDGMVIGRGSALCGSSGDSPWDKRPEPARRSMAVTRATSRAFRQQYSWIMALAGYEPTPADEMPDVPNTPPPPATGRPGRTSSPAGAVQSAGPWQGTASRGQPPTDGSLRETPDGPVFGFRLTEKASGSRPFQVLTEDVLALALSDAPALFDAGREITVHGSLEMVPWEKDGRQMPPYRRVVATRVDGLDLPKPPSEDKATSLDDLPW